MSVVSPPLPSDDSLLVRQAREGSREALAALVRLHQAAVRGFIGRLVHDVDAADDLAQEAFLAAFEQLAKWRESGEFRAWVFAIARNKACSYLRQVIRRRKREGESLELALAEARLRQAEAASDDPDREDWLPRLARCLERLAPHSRRLIELHYYRGQSAESLAAGEGKSGSTVRMALMRIRQALGKCLHESPHDESEIAMSHDTVLRDESIDALLRIAARVRCTEESFVEQLERRLEGGSRADSEAEGPAPPVVAPPVTEPLAGMPVRLAPPPPHQRSRATPSAAQQHKSRELNWPFALTIAGCAALVAVGLGGFFLGRNSQPAGGDSAAQRGAPPARQPRTVVSRQTVASEPNVAELPAVALLPGEPEAVTETPLPPEPYRPRPPQITPVSWSIGGPRERRLPPGKHQLARGTARLDWNDDAQLEVSAPAELEIRDDGTLLLAGGQLRATGNSSASPNPLTTPSARVAAFAGSFSVAVDPSGSTDVKVLAGDVQVQPGDSGEDDSPAFQLSPEEFDRAVIAAPLGIEANGFFSSTLTGRGAQFCGSIQIGEKSLQFGSAGVFHDFQSQVVEGLRRSPDEVLRGWPQLVEKLQGMGGVTLSTDKEGTRKDFRSLQEMFDLLKSMPQGGSSFFQGSINLNGVETKFSNPQEFESARSKFFGPMKAFGGGGGGFQREE